MLAHYMVMMWNCNFKVGPVSEEFIAELLRSLSTPTGDIQVFVHKGHEGFQPYATRSR